MLEKVLLHQVKRHDQIKRHWKASNSLTLLHPFIRLCNDRRQVLGRPVISLWRPTTKLCQAMDDTILVGHDTDIRLHLTTPILPAAPPPPLIPPTPTSESHPTPAPIPFTLDGWAGTPVGK